MTCIVQTQVSTSEILSLLLGWCVTTKKENILFLIQESQKYENLFSFG